MGTYATVIAEKLDEEGHWEECYHESAIEELSRQQYFKFAFLDGVRNYYQLKDNLVPYVLVEKRPQEVHDEMLSSYHPWSRIPDFEKLYAEYNISRDAAMDYDAAMQGPHHAFMIDDLLAFDYTQEIQTREVPDNTYLSNVREIEKGETYLDYLHVEFIDALIDLKSVGAQRIIVIYD